MAESSIPADLLNPGQVFACLGLLELADKLLGNAQGAFDWSNSNDIRFRVRTSGGKCPVSSAIEFFRGASVRSISPSRDTLSTDGWNVATNQLDSNRDAFPFPEPDSPATLPARLVSGDCEVEILHWGDDIPSSGRDNVKFWAGAGGYPGAALARDALALIKEMPAEIAADPLNAPARQSSSFRFDWRRDYVPLDIGFSLNAHSGDRFCTIGYPIVELLAAIGLTHARPARPRRTSKLEYRYGVVSAGDGTQLLDPIFHRAALGAVPLPFRQRFFQMNLGWPGKEGQARCITTVEELSPS
ncbi:MAG: type I-G CRISPR-associated protein Cas8g2 [Verrucomicrobiales bacterium]